MKNVSTFSIDVLRDIEAELSEPLFRGVPLGPTLNDIGVIELHNGHGNWGLVNRWRNRLVRLKHTFRPRLANQAMRPLSENRILVTWLSTHYRVTELVLPVLQELGPERCVVLCATPDMLPEVPAGFDAFCWDQVKHYDVSAWRADYRRCWPEWQRSLRGLCRKHRLPCGTYDRLALGLLIASQSVAGCLELLPVLRPSAILTEYDRQAKWSCLVLAARRLGISTFTMVHGVLNERAAGYVPLLADKVLCWGEMQRRQFIAEGVDPARVLIAGCPRLTRELAVTSADARRKLSLSIEKPVVLLGTTMANRAERIETANLFCAAVERLDGVSAVVRLHPSDRLDLYKSVRKGHPIIRFFDNSDTTLDEALAAADVVVVPDSGLGSDALVKRRLTIVLGLATLRLGHARDLSEQASCPVATDAEELASAIRGILCNEEERQRRFMCADSYVADFCDTFGQESAQLICNLVCGELPSCDATRINKEKSK